MDPWYGPQKGIFVGRIQWESLQTDILVTQHLEVATVLKTNTGNRQSNNRTDTEIPVEV